MLKLRFATLTAIVFATAAGRLLLMGQPNVSPVSAMALFGGAHFRSRWAAFGVPLAAMVVTDLVLAAVHLGAAGLASRPFVYGSFLAIVLLGRMIRNRRTPLWVGGAAIGGSVLFFVVTNLGVWLFSPLYPLTTAGLGACFAAAIPFFHQTLAGDLLFAGLLFGGFALAQSAFPALREAKAAPTT